MDKAFSNVLLVDDDAAVLNAVTFALRAEGFHVSACRTPQAALDTSAHAAPDCLVIDYKLDDSNGLDLVHALRARGVTAPLILVTTNPDARCRALAAKAGAVIVEKPLLGDALSREIKRSLGAAP